MNLLTFLGISEAAKIARGDSRHILDTQDPAEAPGKNVDRPADALDVPITLLDLFYHSVLYCLIQPLAFMILLLKIPTEIVLFKHFVHTYIGIIVGSAVAATLLLFVLLRSKKEHSLRTRTHKSVHGHLFLAVHLIGLAFSLDYHTILISQMIPEFISGILVHLSQLK